MEAVQEDAQNGSQLTGKTYLLFYHALKSVTLPSDASESTLGAAILQERKPNACASKTRSPREAFMLQ